MRLLDKVVLLMHRCVPPPPMQNGSVFTISTDVNHIGTYLAGAVVNFKRSGGSIMPAKILGPGAQCLPTTPISVAVC